MQQISSWLIAVIVIVVLVVVVGIVVGVLFLTNVFHVADQIAHDVLDPSTTPFADSLVVTTIHSISQKKVPGFDPSTYLGTYHLDLTSSTNSTNVWKHQEDNGFFIQTLDTSTSPPTSTFSITSADGDVLLVTRQAYTSPDPSHIMDAWKYKPTGGLYTLMVS